MRKVSGKRAISRWRLAAFAEFYRAIGASIADPGLGALGAFRCVPSIRTRDDSAGSDPAAAEKCDAAARSLEYSDTRRYLRESRQSTTSGPAFIRRVPEASAREGKVLLLSSPLGSLRTFVSTPEIRSLNRPDRAPSGAEPDTNLQTSGSFVPLCSGGRSHVAHRRDQCWRRQHPRKAFRRSLFRSTRTRRLDDCPVTSLDAGWLSRPGR